MVEGMDAVTVSTADRMPTIGRLDAQRDRKVYGVLHDGDLAFEIGRDVDRGVGHEQQVVEPPAQSITKDVGEATNWS